MAHRAHSTDMEDEPMAEPAEEDVMRLAAVLGGGRQGVYHQRIDDARRALAAGVTLPPEPDTPAEAQERYSAAIHASGQWVAWDNHGGNGDPERQRALTEQAVRLLNLDAKYEDGIEAEVERLRDKASARAVKATALALDDARAELARDREDRDLERDLFAVRVAELEAELAETREKVDYWHDAAEVFHAQARGVDAASPTDAWLDGDSEGVPQTPTPDDATGRTDTATELTDDHLHHWLTTLMVRWGKDGIVERLNDRFPAGVRPAAPTVTAEDMMAALKGTLIDAHLTFEPSALGEWAANISRLLAEQGGEG